MTLMRGLRDFIPELNKLAIENAISTLRDEVDFDVLALNHIQLALYLFQEAVNAVLRMHSIKPHWMFALDNLVRSAVQAAITVLSPELGANLAGGEPRVADDLGREDDREPAMGGRDELLVAGVEEGSTSGVSTINSNKSPKIPLLGLQNGKRQRLKKLSENGSDCQLDIEQESEVRLRDDLTETLAALRRENLRLLQELVDSQRSYQDMLRAALSEQQLHLQLVQQQHNVPQQLSSESASSDPALITWLQSHNVNDTEVAMFTREGYTLDDVLTFFNRDDLRRLGLRGGTELRLWRAILEHRSSSTSATPKS